MGFVVYFGVAVKRINSTAQPDRADWTEYNAVWKRDKDPDAPSIEVYAPGVGTPKWNMFYLPETEAYYWITDIVSVRNNVWTVSGVMDVLATYKPYIIATSAMIEYGFNVDSSGNLTRVQDTRQHISKVPQVKTVKADITDAAISWTTGTYILTAVGANGGVTAYALSRIKLKSLLQTVGSDIGDAIASKSSIEEILSYFAENSLMQGSAISAIRSCTWLPLIYSIFTGDEQRIYLGDFDTGVSGRVLDTNQLYIKDTTVAIPWPADDWKRLNCQILMYVPFIGTVGIPVDQCNNNPTLSIRWCVELIGGGVSIRINSGDYTVYTGSANIGVPYAIGASNIPIQNVISGTLAAVGGALQFGGGIASAIIGGAGTLIGGEALIQGVNSAASGMQSMYSGYTQALTPVVQCTGSLSGSAACGQHSTLELTLLYYPPLDDATFQGKFGFPVMRVSTPVAGYCKTRGFSVAIPGRESEAAQINALMDSGVYIE